MAAEAWRLMLECSMAQFGQASGLLHHLGLTPGHLKLLMQSFQCDASTMTWLVDRLEERGLVELRLLSSDRRVKAVALTPRGVQTKAQLTDRLYEPPDALLDLDRAALEGLRDALTKIRNPTQETHGNIPEQASVETA